MKRLHRSFGVLALALAMTVGAHASGLDDLGFENGGLGAGELVWILGTQEGDTGVAKNGAAEFLQGGNDWTFAFTHVVATAVDSSPAMPGYLADDPVTEFDPTGTVAAAFILRIQFTVDSDCTGVIFNYGHYGTEPDLARALDANGAQIGPQSKIIPAGEEDAWIVSDNENPFEVPVGTYTLELRYNGDDDQAVNTEDNGHYIDFIEMTADPGCELGG